MKRGVLALSLFLSFILLASLIYAQTDDVANAASTTQNELKQTAAGAGSNLKTIGGNLTSGLKGAGEDLLERQVSLPIWLKSPMNILLGLEENFSIQNIILILGVFIMFFLFILSILDTFGIFPTKFVQILISFGIAGLISMSGITRFVADFILDIFGSLKFISNMSGEGLFFSILTILVFIVGVRILLKVIKKKRKIEKAKKAGKEVGETIKTAEKINEATEEAGE